MTDYHWGFYRPWCRRF